MKKFNQNYAENIVHCTMFIHLYEFNASTKRLASPQNL